MQIAYHTRGYPCGVSPCARRPPGEVPRRNPQRACRPPGTPPIVWGAGTGEATTRVERVVVVGGRRRGRRVRAGNERAGEDSCQAEPSPAPCPRAPGLRTQGGTLFDTRRPHSAQGVFHAAPGAAPAGPLGRRPGTSPGRLPPAPGAARGPDRPVDQPHRRREPT